MFRNKTKLINETGRPVLATLVAAFLEESEKNIREVAKQRNERYKSLTSAARKGIACKFLSPAFIKSLDNALYEAVAADTSESDNRFREDNMKSYLKTYLTMT